SLNLPVGCGHCARPFRRITANHIFGPPSENLTFVNLGFSSAWHCWMDSISQPSAKMSCKSSRDKRRGPSVPGSSSLKHIRKSWPPCSSTWYSPSTYRRRSSSEKTWKRPQSITLAKSSSQSPRVNASFTRNLAGRDDRLPCVAPAEL